MCPQPVCEKIRIISHFFILILSFKKINLHSYENRSILYRCGNVMIYVDVLQTETCKQHVSEGG